MGKISAQCNLFLSDSPAKQADLVHSGHVPRTFPGCEEVVLGARCSENHRSDPPKWAYHELHGAPIGRFGYDSASYNTSKFTEYSLEVRNNASKLIWHNLLDMLFDSFSH